MEGRCPEPGGRARCRSPGQRGGCSDSSRSSVGDRRVKRYAAPILALALAMVSIAYLYFHQEDLESLKKIEVWVVVAIGLLLVGFYGLAALSFQLTIGLVKVPVTMTESLALCLVGTFSNYLGPISPGAVIKGLYLKSIRDLEVARFAAVYAIKMLIVCFTTGGVGLVLLVWLADASTPGVLWLVCLGLMVASVLPLVSKLPPIPLGGRITRFLNATRDGFLVARTERIRVALIGATTVAQFLVSAGTFYLLYRSLEVPLGFGGAWLMAVFTSMGNLVSITPNNLGLQEILMGFLFTTIGFDFSTGVLGAGVGRAIHIGVTFLLAPIAMHYLLRRTGMTLAQMREKSRLEEA